MSELAIREEALLQLLTNVAQIGCFTFISQITCKKVRFVTTVAISVLKRVCLPTI